MNYTTSNKRYKSMATERPENRTLFINDSEQETNDRLDATLLDIRTRELANAQKEYFQANERFMNSPGSDFSGRMLWLRSLKNTTISPVLQG